MILKLADYITHRLVARGTIRLVMTLLVKNERDIIADNIRVHAGGGVDSFVVMDNGSTDGTREILDTLSREFEIHVIDQPDQTYRQRQWMTQLAYCAAQRFGADWVISSDADEFWISKHGNLKMGLDRKGSVIMCQRCNMLLTEESLRPGYHFFNSKYRVKYPIYYHKLAQRADLKISIPLTKIKGKIMVNPHGLIKMLGGNHRARHIAGPFNRRLCQEVTVYHYPVRSYEQFERNVKNRQKLAHLEGVRMGDHYFRWVQILESGGLHSEYRSFVLDQRDIEVLSKYGVIEQDLTPGRYITNALRQCYAQPGAANQ